MSIKPIQNNSWQTFLPWAAKAVAPALIAAAYFFSPYPQNSDELTGRCTVGHPNLPRFSFGQCPIFTPSLPDWLEEASDDTRISQDLDQALHWGKGDVVCQALLKFPDYKDKEWAFGKLAANDDTQSIHFLVEGGIVDPSDFNMALLWSARENACNSLNYLVPLGKKEHLHTAVYEAIRHGHLPALKACLQGDVDLEELMPQALDLASHGGHLPIVTLITRIYEHSSANLDKALFTAAQKGHTSVVEYLCKQPTSEEMRNKALHESAQFKHRQTYAALIEAGADPFTTETTSNFAIETGCLSTEIGSLSPDKQYQSLIAHMKKGALPTPLFLILQENFATFAPKQQFALLESLFDPSQEKTTDWILSQTPLLEPEHQFLMARLALLKDCPQFPAFKAVLSGENQAILETLEQRIAFQKEEQLALRKSILAADLSRSERPPHEAWERETQERILPHKEKILQFTEHKVKDGVRLYKECGQINVFEFDDLPGLIFKTFEKGFNAEMRYRQSKEANALCERENLYRLRIPYSTVIPPGTIGNSKPILIEEKQSVLDGRADYQERAQLMSRDPELSPILKETFRQATVFISRMGYYDPRANNAPLLKGGTGMALVDIDGQGAHPQSGIYTFQPDKLSALIYSVDEENIDTLRNTLLEIDAERFENFDFAHHEQPRREHFRMLKYREGALLKRGLLDNDPIQFDISLFSPEEQEMANKIVAAFNTKLANKDYNGDLRALHLTNTDKMDITGRGNDYTKNKPTYDRVMDVLQRKEVIFSVTDLGGHGKIYYC